MQAMLHDMSPGRLRARLGPRSRARGDAPGGAEPGSVQGGGGPPVGGPPGAAAPSSAMRPPLSRGAPPARTASASQRTSSGGMHVLSVINLDTFLNNFRRAPAALPQQENNMCSTCMLPLPALPVIESPLEGTSNGHARDLVYVVCWLSASLPPGLFGGTLGLLAPRSAGCSVSRPVLCLLFP